MKKPLVSIVTVCYNSDKTIRRTIESILNQTYDNIEYIIIDGASKDDTVKVIRSYQKIFENKGIKYKWISEPDRGIYDAMNKGVGLATGDLIAIIGSDDWYELNAVREVMDCYLSTKADFIHGNINYISVNGNSINKKPKAIIRMKRHMCLFHPCCFISKSLYDKVGHYNTEFKIAADYDFLLRAIKLDPSIKYIDTTLANFSTGGVSSVEIEKSLLDEHRVKKANGYASLSNWLYYWKSIISFRIKKKLSLLKG